MSNTLRTVLLGILCTTTIAFHSCIKVTDYLEDNPQATLTSCQITRVAVQPDWGGDSLIYNYTYNAYGDPVSITHNEVGTGNPNRFFRYNAQHRLTDYIGEYDNTLFEFWHKYVYNGAGQVIRDTVFFWGDKGGPQPVNYYDFAIVTYSYDASGRITHTQQIWNSYPSGGLDQYYNYDVNGNLVIPGAVYDNKVSAQRTNRIWMFLDRNYSVNNVNATAWTAWNLPTLKTLGGSGVGNFGTIEIAGGASISYSCTGTPPPATVIAKK